MAKFAGLRDPVTLDFEVNYQYTDHHFKYQLDFQRSLQAYCVDAFSISMGALMGTSPVTAFIESATGQSFQLAAKIYSFLTCDNDRN